MVEQVAVNDKVLGSNPSGTAKVEYSSGQRGQTVNLLPAASGVRIPPLPLNTRLAPSSSGLGHRPFTAGTGVRVPVGSLATVAQLAEQLICNQQVVGSSPTGSS